MKTKRRENVERIIKKQDKKKRQNVIYRCTQVLSNSGSTQPAI